MKKLMMKIAVLAALAAALVLTSAAWLPFIGTYLAGTDDIIGKADCIVPLAGDAYFRFAKAAELYKKGYAKGILVSIVPEREGRVDENAFRLRLLALRDISEKEFVVMAFKYFGVEPADIDFTRPDVTSTYEEAVATREAMLKRGYRSLILVTSAYHTRRALLIFGWVLKGSGIRVYHCAAENTLYDPVRWWQRERDVKTVAQEYVSIVYNIVYHFMLRKGRTSFDMA